MAPRKSLQQYLVHYLSLFVWGALALLGTNLMNFAIPKVIGWFIDALGPPSAPRPGGGMWGARALVQDATRHAPHWIAVILIGLATLSGGLRLLSRLAVFGAGRRIEYDLRHELFAHLCRLSPSFYRRTPTGEILSRAVNDLTAVRVVFGPGVLNVVNTLVVYVVGLTLLLRLDPLLTALSLLPYPVVLVLGRRLGRRIFESSSDVQARLGDLTRHAQETLSNMQVVQVYGGQERRAQGYAAMGQAYVEANLALARARGAMMPLTSLIGGVGLLVTLWVGGRRVIQGGLSLGQFVEFQGYLAMLAWPTLALGWVLSLWQRGRAALERVDAVLQTPPTLCDPQAGGVVPERFRGALSVRGLSLQRGEATVLDDVSIEVPAGTHLGIVGPTGSGKSTLAEALARSLEVPPGTVLLDGLDVTELPLQAVRAAIGYAQQEPFLFASSVRYNLALGLPAAEDDDRQQDQRLWEVADLVRLKGEIEALPRGLDTPIGERGVQLSGGQRQRLSLGRALLPRPPVLVLDDALSAVDAATEAEILRALPSALAGCTAVLVSHRVAAVQRAHQIIVLDRGRIVERGTHDELLRRGGLYAELSRLQSLSEEIEAEVA